MGARQLSLTADRLREVLSYDLETGAFIWRFSGRGRFKRAGAVAGRPNRDGYTVICVDGVEHMAHRLAWLYVHGSHPAQTIDHIDGQRDRNAISNLRDVPIGVNLQNARRARRGTRSGLLGVSWQSAAAQWVASIRAGGKQQHLGFFDCKDRAHAAYVAAKRQLHEGCTL